MTKSNRPCPLGYALETDELLKVYSRGQVLVFDQSVFKEHGFFVFKTEASAKKYLVSRMCELYPTLSLRELSDIRVEKARICVGVLFGFSAKPRVARVYTYYLNYLPLDDSCFTAIVSEPHNYQGD